MTRIRAISAEDRDEWVRMRQALWPEEDLAVHPGEIDLYFRGELSNPVEVLVAEGSEGLIGFAELSLRNYAEGCVTDRVGYLEGWWVDVDHRRLGVGRALVEAAFAWARSHGCTEFASDADIDNQVSQRAHEALGFAEAGRAVCYRFSLAPSCTVADRDSAREVKTRRQAR